MSQSNGQNPRLPGYGFSQFQFSAGAPYLAGVLIIVIVKMRALIALINVIISLQLITWNIV